ncbi:hypothetical protein Pmani_011174 [Petrolisthes manimaculis]|uniref:Endonuclease/exonuclease/phosphatase domain-containing protein n=1 Tax=Petrolisthes manimaculis TaxID=1843537 RepID=A0AAE1Q029_9EUCA|nr:hypothetical protein Pmani_011174 [Petrolisthes manimaculis]
MSRMADPSTSLPPPQGGGLTTNDHPKTKADNIGTPTADRPRRQDIDIPSLNARYVNVRCVDESQSLKTVNPFIIKKVLDGQVGGSLEFAKKLRDGSLLVKVLNSSQVKDLLKLTQIHSFKVKTTIPVGPNTCKGVIFHRDLADLDDADILDGMKDQGVVEVQSMTRMRENKREKFGLVFMTFAAAQIPDTVKIGYEIVHVRPYIQKPMRCFRCQKFGHTALRCFTRNSGEFICGKCAGSHETNLCSETVFKCANCGGPHQAGAGICRSLIVETETMAYMKAHDVSYGEAKRKVEGVTQVPTVSYAGAVAGSSNAPAVNDLLELLKAKEKENQALNDKVNSLESTVVELKELVAELVESTKQQKQKPHKANETEKNKQSQSHVLAQVTPTKHVSGTQTARRASSCSRSGSVTRGEAQAMETIISKPSRGRSPGSAEEEEGTPSQHKKETHLDNRVEDEVIQLRNYELIRKDRDGRGGGGVALYIRRSLPFTEVPSNFPLESVACRVKFGGTYLTVCSVYCPPDTVTYDDVFDLQDSLPCRKLIVGDFNAHHTLWGSLRDDRKGEQMARLISNSGLILLNDGSPTRVDDNTGNFSVLDLSLVSPSIATSCQWLPIDDSLGSDHFPILIKYNSDTVKEPSAPKFNVKKADWVSFTKSLNIEIVGETIDDKVNNIKDSILKAATATIPKTSIDSAKHRVPWWTPDCRIALCERNRAYRLFKTHISDENFRKYKLARARARRTIKQAKRDSWRSFVSTINSETSISNVWSTVKKLNKKKISLKITNIKHNNVNFDEPRDIANALARQFSFASSSDNYHPAFLPLKEASELQHINFATGDELDYNCDLTMQELVQALGACSGTSPGPDEIRSRVDYGSIVYGSASESVLKGVDVVQNACLRVCLGALRCTRIERLEVESQVPPLRLRRDQLMLTYFAKKARVPSHPPGPWKGQVIRLGDARPRRALALGPSEQDSTTS